MGVQVVQNISSARAITHGGSFHAGDVLATAILSQVISNLTVARVSQLPPDIAPGVVTYDIEDISPDNWRGIEISRRDNGVPYHAAGLIWRRFGPRLCAGTVAPQDVWLFVDQYLIQGIDDNDDSAFPFSEYPSQMMSIVQAISCLNPQQNIAEGDTDIVDRAFVQAVEFMSAILKNTISYAEAIAQIKIRERAAIEQSEQKCGEKIGTKLCENLGKTAYIRADGIITVIASNSILEGDGPALKKLMLSCGYTSLNSYGNCRQLVFAYEGKSIEDLNDELKRRSAASQVKRNFRANEQQKWKKLREDMDGFIIKIVDVDDYNGGFTVWVSLSTNYTYDQQRRFVQYKKEGIVAFVKDELPNQKRFKRYADLLQFCNIVEITITRQNAVIVKYELKPEILTLLK